MSESEVAKVKADLLRELATKTRTMPADAGKLAAWLRAEAERIEREADDDSR